MTRPEAVDDERAQLDAMIQLLNIKLAADPVKRERPDFLLTVEDGRSIGVEVVRALDQWVAGGRGARQRIKRGVHAALEAAGIKAWVNVRLSEHTAAFLAREGDELRGEISAIVDLVRGAVEAGLGAGWHYYEWIDHEAEHPWISREEAELDGRDEEVRDLAGTGVKHVDVIGIYPHDELVVTWSMFGSGQRPSVVQDAIDAKAKNLAVYRECGADEIWLLVVGSAGTGGALLVDDVDDRVFVSPYDRTVFLELYQGRCVVLRTQPNAEASPDGE